MNVILWIVTLLFLWASGEIVMTAIARSGRGFRSAVPAANDPLVRLALRVGAGLSIWPLVVLATTRLGVVIAPRAMATLVYATILAATGLAVMRFRVIRAARIRPAAPLLIAFAILAALAIATRVSHIRGLAFPPWVDGVHHAMIVRLLLEHGAVPMTAGPYIDGAPFFYHFGFHVPAALVAAATGVVRHSELPSFLLQYGQLLNALSVLMVYAAGRVLLRSREGGLVAAALAMFVSYYPAFYLSWGRYTHLAGTLILPPLLIALWALARSSRPLPWTVLSAILAGGLLLTHVRVALFALVSALVMLIAVRPHVGRTLLRWSAAAILAAGLAGPWLIGLVRNPHVTRIVTPAPQRAFPAELVASPHNRELLALATGGVSGMAGWLAMPMWERGLSAAWWVLIVWLARRQHSRRRSPLVAQLLLGATAVLLSAVLYWKPAGIDLSGFATFDSAVITMFLPLSLAAAALIVWVVANLLPRLRYTWRFALVVVISVAGAATTRSIVNPATVFADASDLRAMRWIEAHVTPDAVFAVDSRPWIPPARVGIDGGYWLHVTTGRRSILPPLLYAWSLPSAKVATLNAVLETWSSASPDWRAIRAAGITHIYIGSRGTAAKREALLATNRVRLLYRDGGVLVFSIR